MTLNIEQKPTSAPGIENRDASVVFASRRFREPSLPLSRTVHSSAEHTGWVQECYIVRLENLIQIVTETGLRIYKELATLRKEHVDLLNGTAWIPDSKTVNGVAEVPLTEIAIEAFRRQLALSGPGPFLFPSEEDPNKHQKTFKTTWRATLRRAGVPYFRIYDLRSTYATRLSAGGVADEFVTQLLRQGTRRCSRSTPR